MNEIMKWLQIGLVIMVAESGHADYRWSLSAPLYSTSFGETRSIEQTEYLVNPDPSAAGTAMTPEAAHDKIQQTYADAAATEPRHASQAQDDRIWVARHPYWTAVIGIGATVGILAWGHDTQGWFQRDDSSNPEPISQTASGQGVAVQTGDNSPVNVSITTTTTMGNSSY